MRYKGVISPDFSLYRDMPLVMQEWNVYRNRALAHWLQTNGVHVIPNIRWGDERTYELCCTGIAQSGTIAVGSHGCVKNSQDRKYFEEGLDYVIERLRPDTIVMYGKVLDSIRTRCLREGITIQQFDSEFETTHRKKVCV